MNREFTFLPGVRGNSEFTVWPAGVRGNSEFTFLPAGVRGNSEFTFWPAGVRGNSEVSVPTCILPLTAGGELETVNSEPELVFKWAIYIQ